MTKTVFTACVLALATGTALAQNRPGKGAGQGNAWNGNRGNPVERLTEVLGLDAGQAAAIAAIFEDAQLHVKRRANAGRRSPPNTANTRKRKSLQRSSPGRPFCTKHTWRSAQPSGRLSQS